MEETWTLCKSRHMDDSSERKFDSIDDDDE